LLDRILTRINLRRQNVLPSEVLVRCVLCDVGTERSNHLFLHCSVAIGVWLELLNWAGCMFIMPHNVFVHWACWNADAVNKNTVKGFMKVGKTTRGGGVELCFQKLFFLTF